MTKTSISLLRRAAAILTLSLGTAGLSTSFAQETPARFPEVWIKSGVHSANTPQVWKAMREDTGDPWAPGAPWQTVLGQVKVVGVSPGAIQWASGPELQTALAGMKRAHVSLALGTGLLTRSDRCQAHNEAMAAPGEFEQMLLKIQRNGGDLRYIVMDEPYYFGHKDTSVVTSRRRISPPTSPRASPRPAAFSRMW